MSLMWSPAPSPKQYMAAAQALRDVRQTSSRSCTTGRARTLDACSRGIRTDEADEAFTSCHLGLDQPSSKSHMSICT